MTILIVYVRDVCTIVVALINKRDMLKNNLTEVERKGIEVENKVTFLNKQVD